MIVLDSYLVYQDVISESLDLPEDSYKQEKLAFRETGERLSKFMHKIDNLKQKLMRLLHKKKNNK